MSTPVPFRPKHTREFSEVELEALERLNLSASESPNSPLRSSTTADSITTPSKLNIQANAGSVSANKIDIELLEKKAEAVNGHKEEA